MSDCRHERTWMVRAWDGQFFIDIIFVCRDCSAWGNADLWHVRQEAMYDLGALWELLPPHPAVTEPPPGYEIVPARALRDERANAAAMHDLVQIALDGGTMGPGWEEAARQALAGTAGAALLQEREGWQETFRELGAKLEAARAAKEEAEASARSLAGRLAQRQGETDADRAAVRALVEALNGALYVPTGAVEPLAALRGRMASWDALPGEPVAPDADERRDVEETDPYHAVAPYDWLLERDHEEEERDRRVAAANRIAWLELSSEGVEAHEAQPLRATAEGPEERSRGIIVGAPGYRVAEVRGGQVGAAVQRVDLRPGQSAEVIAVAGPALAEDEEPSAGDVREAR